VGQTEPQKKQKYHNSNAKKLLLIHKKKKEKPDIIPIFQDAPRPPKWHLYVGSFSGFSHLNS
jgi:fibrillarin-like rRNA methylase